MLKAEDHPLAARGGMLTMPGAPPASLPYISVEDLKAATDKAASPGAKVIMPEQEVPARVGSPSSSLSGANVAPWPGK